MGSHGITGEGIKKGVLVSVHQITQIFAIAKPIGEGKEVYHISLSLML